MTSRVGLLTTPADFYDKDRYVAKVVDVAAAHFGRTLSKSPEAKP